ncbi:hypothetical protein ACQU0X_25845 [Pseudovibrio ascidiaceicola]|uniref:hypothetical protein n=1 Tax=Pseudovibrio ascidiaceicola TaxID=285279 RepID=UPI003D36E04A
MITLHKLLPDKSTQIAAARAWGIPQLSVDGNNVTSVLIDDVLNAKRTTNWKPLLPKRQRLLDYFAEYETHEADVFFATPLCLGWAEKLATELVSGIMRGGGSIYIHDIGLLYRPGDNLDGLWAEWHKQWKTVTQADYRVRRRQKDEND